MYIFQLKLHLHNIYLQPPKSYTPLIIFDVYYIIEVLFKDKAYMGVFNKYIFIQVYMRYKYYKIYYTSSNMTMSIYVVNKSVLSHYLVPI